MQKFILFFIASLLSSFLYATNSIESASISLFQNKWGNEQISVDKIKNIIRNAFNLKQYREIKVQVIYNNKKQPDHLLVFLLSKQYHGFELVRINIDSQYNVLSFEYNYHPTEEDRNQQPSVSINAKCPDPATQFIAFAPNDDALEQKITKDVAASAKAHHLKVVSLLLKDATTANYLNYMTCPKLIGNFYDGDSDPFSIVTADGMISFDDINKILQKKFRFKVTNIWLACEAFNDPMKSAVIEVAQAQKYAAGINDLLVGPSDRAAACAMESAMNHNPMKEAFYTCYQKFDVETDQWGFDGHGSNYFGM